MSKKNDTVEAAGKPVADLEAAADKGYLGTTPDPTPNENYTVAGVTSGAPTPETTRGPKDERQQSALGEMAARTASGAGK